ncbi:MAG TPA: N-acyl homoserine lactonase family protein [Burkholderiaceae bacterium]|nr:N-acyl homoserine lactonase family protein [Burkholderiaceae bacterium]
MRRGGKAAEVVMPAAALQRTIAAIALCLSTFTWPDPAHASPPLALYTLDCGRVWFKDLSVAADTGELDGHAGELADPCFLVHHPRGWLLWDAGLPAQWPGADGLTDEALARRDGVRVTHGAPLAAQLLALGLSPDDVTHLAFSHLHFDHVGQTHLFRRATWILNRAELDWALAQPPHFSMVASLLAARDGAQVQMIDGDHDVFGDGRVRILKAPGHTPGSGVLLLKLPKTGAVLLSGDLYISRAGRTASQVPQINADRAQTLASMARIERIAQRLKARVIVQHDPADYARLPKPPHALQ